MPTPNDRDVFEPDTGKKTTPPTAAPSWRKPWMGHVIASLFVGTALYLGNVCLSCFPWAPPLVGYAVPLMVVRFSTWWSGRPFSLRAAFIISAVMGTAFFGLYRCPIPYVCRVGVGYIAPCAVSMLAKSAVIGGFLAGKSD
ncbi:MAG: hypothetical protein ABGY41_17760 [Candidatus Poribacteria bacterium]